MPERAARADSLALEVWDPADEATAAQLRAGAVGVDGRVDPGASWFRWKMAESPWGAATIAFARDRDTGAIAGVVAFGRWRFWHRGALVPAALSYETWVGNDYRRRGLFTRLTRHAMDELRRRGVELIVNFPNATSLPGFLKLGFTNLGGFQTWVRPRGVRAAVRLAALVFGGDRSTSVAPADAPTVDDAWIARAATIATAGARLDAPWVSVRDEPILRWRYGTHGTFSYVTSSARDVALLARVERRGALVELRVLEAITGERPRWRALAEAINQLADRAGADLLTFQVTRASPIVRLLPMLGFLPAPDHIAPCAFALGGAHALPPGRTWVMTAGDFHTS